MGAQVLEPQHFGRSTVLRLPLLKQLTVFHFFMLLLPDVWLTCLPSSGQKPLSSSPKDAAQRMKPPLSCVSSHVFVDQLRAEVSELRGILSCWLTAALVSSGLAGIGVLSSGIIVGAELHKSGYIVGGILAVLGLLLFAAIQETWSVVCILLGLLEFDDAISREDILNRLTNYMQKHTSAKRAKSAVIPENSDFDEATLRAMEGLPAKLLSLVTRALQAGPAAVSIASALCAVLILHFSSVPDEVSALPIAFASLAIGGGICGLYVRLRASALIHKIAFQKMEFDGNRQRTGSENEADRFRHGSEVDHFSSTSFSQPPQPLNATLLELYMNMLRRKLASTSRGGKLLASVQSQFM